ncbi:MAG: hypothetical protein WBB98_10835 [Xanthobacteraceae bacterium]
MDPRPTEIKIPFKGGETCPCGLNKRYDECHGSGKNPPISPFHFELPASSTGKQVNGCYMSSLQDCDGALSLEHYISQSILKQFDIIRGEGLQGNLDELPSIPIKALAVRVLCQRHNALLSDLDTRAGLAFERIRTIQQHMIKPIANRRKVRDCLIDGYALELWAAKSLLATYVGKVARTNGQPTIDVKKLNVDAVVKRIAAGRLEPPFGLYMHKGPRFTKRTVSAGALTDGDQVVGIRMQLGQLGFDCIVAPAQRLDPANYRPCAAIYWNKASFNGNLFIAWDGPKRNDWVYSEELD